jgi:4'-phosphopantetheinyl transferase
MPIRDNEMLQTRGREKTTALSRMARQAALLSAQASSLTLYGFEKNERGAPLPSCGVYWSISHKKDRVAGVVSRQPVGIDIETIKPVAERLYRRVVRTDEARLFETHDRDVVFFRVFTAKEAVLKQTTDGIGQLSKVTVVKVADDRNLHLLYLNQKYWVENFFGDGYFASVTKQAEDVQWSVIESQ